MASHRGRHEDDAGTAPELIRMIRVAGTSNAGRSIARPAGYESRLYRNGIGGRTTGPPSSATFAGRCWRHGAAAWPAGAALRRPAAIGAGAAGGAVGGRLRLAHRRRGGAAARRGGVGPQPGAAGSDRQAWFRQLLASEVLAISRAIWAWPALSCAMLAFSSSTCWPMLARSCAIDCNWLDSAEGAAAAVAAAACAG